MLTSSARLEAVVAASFAAALAVAACHQLAGLEEPTEPRTDASTPEVSAPDAGSDAPVDARSCTARDGGRCFCDSLANPPEAAILRCVDFDEDGLDPETFGLEPGPLANVTGPLTLAVDEARPLSAPRAMRVDVVEGLGIGIRARAVTVPGFAPTETTIQFSATFDKLDAGPYDAASPNRTIMLLFLELSPEAPRAIVFGVDYKRYSLSVVENLQNPSTSQVQEAGIVVPGSIVGPDDGYTTFVLSVENRSDCAVDGGMVPGMTAVLRAPSGNPAVLGTQLACRPLGAAPIGKDTRVYIGGYIKNPIEPLDWRFDNIVVRKRPE